MLRVKVPVTLKCGTEKLSVVLMIERNLEKKYPLILFEMDVDLIYFNGRKNELQLYT